MGVFMADLGGKSVEWLGSRGGLAVARLLGLLPDLHRIGPYWRVVRWLRVIALRASGVQMHSGTVVHEGVYIDRRVRVTLGEGTELRDHVRIGIAEAGDRAGTFVLGAGSVVLSEAHIDCSAPVTIGEGTHIGRRTQIFSHRHDIRARSTPVLHAPITVAPVIIGDDVMVYNDTVILPGVRIGDGAVIAIRSVVTRDVPAGAIVAGVPAKVVGFRTGVGAA